MSMGFDLKDTMAEQIEKLSAKIQDRVAEFLKCRGRIVKLRGKRDQAIINSLLQSQTTLEDQLSIEFLPRSKSVQEGTWTVEDLYAMGTFYYNMENHIKNVKQLESSPETLSLTAEGAIQGIQGQFQGIMDSIKQYKNWLIVGGIVLLIYRYY